MRTVFALLILIAVVPRAAAETPESPLRVGVILPLTGEMTSFGTAIKNGIDMALDSLEPELRRAVDVQFENDGFFPAQTVGAYRKLSLESKPHVVISAGSSTSNALAPVIEQDQVPLLAIATDPAVCRGRHYANNFWVTPREEVRVLLPEVEKRGYKKVARISTVHAFPEALNSEINTQNKNIEIVLDKAYQPDVRDFRTYIARLRTASDVDAAFVLLMPGQLGIFARQARQLGFTKPFIGFELMEDPKEVEVSQGGLESAWYVNAADPDSRFVESYEKRFPGASMWAAGNGYDSVLLIVEALKQHIKERGALAKFFRSTNGFKGSLGTIRAVGDGTFVFPATLKQVRGGKFEALN